MMYRIDVLLDVVYLSICTYLSVEKVEVGEVVEVTLRNKKKIGIVIANPSQSNIHEGLKYIVGRRFIKFHDKILKVIFYLARYYCISEGKVVSLFLNKYLTYKPIKSYHVLLKKALNNIRQSSVLLTEQQMNVVNDISYAKPNLIFGITGSGKTEVYFYIMQKYILQGKQVLILLPEIHLAINIAKRCEERFNCIPLLWHSKSLQKSKIINKIINNYPIIIGTRSSLFLPFQNLGCIIVDEEHDISYKQDSQVMYHARDVAVLLAYYLNIQVCLFSATPTLESYYNSLIGKYNLLYLQQQYSNINLPEVQVVEYQDKTSLLHKNILDQITLTVKKGEQVMIYLNRKGYYRLVFCNTCNIELKCNNCSIPLVWYQKKAKLYCHYCGAISNLLCLECKGHDFRFYGLGIEQLYEYIIDVFTDLRVQYITSDSKNIDNTICSFINGEIDIIITTQIMAKGYHCPGLTLVVMLNMNLNACPTDFRANEHNLQMLYQVKGRCGREKKGIVILQSIKKDDVILDYEDFLKKELKLRQEYYLPPINTMIGIIISGRYEDFVKQEGYEVLKFYMQFYQNIKGPVESLIYKVNNVYRLRIFIVLSKHEVFYAKYVKKHEVNTIKYDIDIYNFF